MTLSITFVIQPCFILILGLCSNFILIAESKQVIYNFEVRYFNGSPDGVRKSILGVNGQFPGPTIRVEIGDFLTVRVTNNIQTRENTSIHWHGLEQYLSPFQDGPEMVTQCPIGYGQTQIYQFQLLQSGTYWWHSHHSYQYTEGCWGSFIVENPNDPHIGKYDEELIVTLNDWYHLPGKQISEWYLSRQSEGLPPIPNSGMINGVGRYDCMFAQLQNQVCSTSIQRFPVFEVSRNRRYRIRVINTSAMTNFIFSIDNHKLKTIEVDGVDTVEVDPVDEAFLAPAQRYSFIVEMTNQDEDQHWIRANVTQRYNFPLNTNPYPDSFEKDVLGILRYTFQDNNAFLGAENIPILLSRPTPATAITLMQGRPATHDGLTELSVTNSRISAPAISNSSSLNQKLQYEPITSPNIPNTQRERTPKMLRESNCRPFAGDGAPRHFDQSITINSDLKNMSNGIQRGSLNDVVYKIGLKPILYEVINRQRIPRSSNAINTVYGIGKVVQLVINIRDFRNHPFHLHGHSFYVVGMGSEGEGDFHEVRDAKRLVFNGVRRDTILAPVKSWVVLRYHADNPGVWLFHCHMNWHFEAGLGLVLVEGGPALVSRTFGTRLNGTEGMRLCRKTGIY